MKKILIFLFANFLLVSFLVYTGYLLTISSLVQQAGMGVRVLFGLMHFGLTVLLAVELNRRLKQYLNEDPGSND